MGWWYAEPDADHFDNWVQHVMPHLLVLHNLETSASHWVHVTAQAVASTGKGFKILVPVGQTIGLDHLDQLLAVAATQKATVALEGTAWTAGAHTVAPARRLRHAMLAPRLVAPHRNAASGAPLDPNEAIALLVLGRSAELTKFAESHRSVPTLTAAASSKDWRWRFVAAFARLVADHDSAELAATIGDAPTPDCRVAAAVVTACALMDKEKHEEAATLLKGQIGEDDAGPVDPPPRRASSRKDGASAISGATLLKRRHL